MESLGQSPEQFISCADPRLRNQLFYGVLELYDGSQLIATSEDYAQTYTKFDIKNPILIKSNTEKKFTVKANMQSNGLGTQCSFSVIPNILGNTGSFSTHESNYITTIKGTDASQFRFSSWTCYNGEKQDNGGSSSCKSTDMWRKYAEDFCAQKCSPETGKCGVNSFSNSEPCGQTTICGNGIVEGTEQCDDGNTVNSDGCDSICKIESALSCVDSDGGRKEYIKAITTGFSVYPDEGYTSKGDYCIQKKIDGTFNLNTSLRDPYSAGQVSECTNNCAVMENSCSPANVIVADVINCPNGCSDGACKK